MSLTLFKMFFCMQMYTVINVFYKKKIFSNTYNKCFSSKQCEVKFCTQYVSWIGSYDLQSFCMSFQRNFWSIKKRTCVCVYSKRVTATRFLKSSFCRFYINFLESIEKNVFLFLETFVYVVYEALESLHEASENKILKITV